MSFIALEGFYSVGKTCIARKLKENLSEAIFIKEPGGTYEGKEIRKVMNSYTHSMEEETKSLLYLSSLYEASKKIIELNRSQLIFCERWDVSLSALRYAKGIQPSWLVPSIMDSLQIPRPDVCVLIHTPFNICIDRLKGTQNGKKVIFSLGEETLWKMHDFFYREAEGIQIDGNRNISEVVKDIILLVGYANGERTIT